jgi:hypothetical protein
MSAGDAHRKARRGYLKVRALGGGVKTRPHPDDPTRLQLGLFGLRSLEQEQADSLRERVLAVKPEMISLVWASENLDARAVLEEGAA